MFAVMNPPKKRRKKGKKLRKGCRRVAVRSCKTSRKRRTKRSSSYRGCKGLSPEACLTDYELSGLTPPRGL